MSDTVPQPEISEEDRRSIEARDKAHQEWMRQHPAQQLPAPESTGEAT